MSPGSTEGNDMRSYLQSHADHVTRHLAVRPVMRHLLKKGIITVTKAQDVIAMETEEGKQEATFRLLLLLDRKQMEDLCYYLDRNNASETANILAASLYPRHDGIKHHSPRNINNNAIEKKDSPESKPEQNNNKNNQWLSRWITANLLQVFQVQYIPATLFLLQFYLTLRQPRRCQ